MSARDSFLKNFDRVRADSGGTGMDSSSCLDDVNHFDLKKVPDHFTQPQLPEVHNKVEHPEVAVFEQPKAPRARVSADLDEKHKRFIETFDHVPEYRNIHYDGQAAVQDKEMSSQLLKELPDAPPREPQIDMAEAEGRVDIPVFSEDREVPVPPARRLSNKQHSAKYKMAHDAFEALYREPMGNDS